MQKYLEITSHVDPLLIASRKSGGIFEITENEDLSSEIAHNSPHNLNLSLITKAMSP